MRKRSLSSMLLSIIVVIAVLFLSFPLETEKVQAKDRKHTLVFVSNEISSEQISELFTSNEKTMQKVLKSVNEQKIKVKNISSPQQLKNSPSFQSLAIHYKTLENNNEIKSYVQEQYNSGRPFTYMVD